MIYRAFKRANENFPTGGTCLEFGVYVGWSYMVQVNAILKDYPNTKLIGFDSWEGLPEETADVWFPERHGKGKFKTSKDVVLKQLGDLANDPRFKLVDGFFKDSLTKELQDSIKDLIYVNIDVDIHSSTVEVLEFIRPLLRPGVTIYFDDWKDPEDKYLGKWGEHLAWEEFINKYPEIKYKTIEINEYNQRYMEIE